MATRYWIGVVSHNHVKLGVAGGFAQLCHGKAAPLRRMKQGDWLIYYSPKTEMNQGDPLQSFTAIGQVRGDAPYLFEMSADFIPYRLDVDYLPAKIVAIQPLLSQLSFITDLQHWGYSFRFGHLEITESDFLLIKNAMKT